jgi:hypothetical protein
MIRLRPRLCALVGAWLLWAALGVGPGWHLSGVPDCCAIAPSVAHAQDTGKTAKKAERHHKKPRGKHAKERAAAEAKPESSSGVPDRSRGHPSTAEPKKPAQGTSDKGSSASSATSARDAARTAAQDAAQGANSAIVKEGDTSVKVMQFSGLDIEGRLKSPQLLYFVNRVRAEFDRPRLPHRSFMPELQQSTETEPLR